MQPTPNHLTIFGSFGLLSVSILCLRSPVFRMGGRLYRGNCAQSSIGSGWVPPLYNIYIVQLAITRTLRRVFEVRSSSGTLQHVKSP
jgi:hypothetical protein